MQSAPFKTFKEAEEATKSQKYEGYDTVYARPNPDKAEGGFVVIFGNSSSWGKPRLRGCPRASW